MNQPRWQRARIVPHPDYTEDDLEEYASGCLVWVRVGQPFLDTDYAGRRTEYLTLAPRDPFFEEAMPTKRLELLAEFSSADYPEDARQ